MFHTFKKVEEKINMMMSDIKDMWKSSNELPQI